jgi:hypothetical protein
LTRSSRLAVPLLALPIVLGAARAPVARAQPPLPLRADSVWLLDSRVVQVISGGTWAEGDRSGHYRILVRSDGKDEVHYTTVVQWLLRRGLSQDLELVQSLDVSTVATRWYSMLDPELRFSRGRWILVLDASAGPRKPATHRAQFVLGPPGRITIR